MSAFENSAKYAFTPGVARDGTTLTEVPVTLPRACTKIRINGFGHLQVRLVGIPHDPGAVVDFKFCQPGEMLYVHATHVLDWIGEGPNGDLPTVLY